MMSIPVPITATVTPPAVKAPRCAAASHPSASPLTTITPARARSAASCSATASPYGEGRREPTMATLGPSGGGQVPRALSVERSGGDVMKSVTQRFQDVPVADGLRAFEIGGGPCHTPGAMKAAGGQTLLLGPAFERAPGSGFEKRHLAQPPWLQLGVEAALPVELATPGGGDTSADCGRSLASRFRRQLGERHAPDSHLEVDAVEQRSGKAPLVGIDQCRGAAAGPGGVAQPPARTRVGGRHQREPRGIGDGSARSRDGDASGLQRLAQGLQNRRLKLGELIQKEHTVIGWRAALLPDVGPLVQLALRASRN